MTTKTTKLPLTGSVSLQTGEVGRAILLPSTRKLIDRVAQTCIDNNCDPFEILCRIALGDAEYLGWGDSANPISMTVRMEAASRLCPYLAPTFKSSEVKEEGRHINVNFHMGVPPK